jgi:hypothetical protein
VAHSAVMARGPGAAECGGGGGRPADSFCRWASPCHEHGLGEFLATTKLGAAPCFDLGACLSDILKMDNFDDFLEAFE